ncbi:MAG: sigma-70 family RNA polymerase sigma factor [Candidatus Diapherotrites archaeon]
MQLKRKPKRIILPREKRAREKLFITRELMEKAKRDPKAFDHLVKKAKSYFESIAVKFNPTAEEKKDLVQRSLIKLHRTLPQYNPKIKANPSTFLYRVALNEMIDYMRKKKSIAKKEVSLEEIIVLGDRLKSRKGKIDNSLEFKIKVLTPEEKYEIKEIYNKVIRIIKRMAPKHQDIVFCRFGIEGKPFLKPKEIGERFGISEVTVRWRTARILKQVRKYIKENGLIR